MKYTDITPLLTDYYQLSMVYIYWKTGRTEELATFEMFFRKNPFGGEFTINAGFEDVIKYLKNLKFTDNIIANLEEVLNIEKEDKEKFFKYLQSLDFKDVDITFVEEGRVVFPRTPILSFTGKLPIVQLVETTVLNLCNFSSLIATNASRMRLQEPKQLLLEFGLRRAQGPNGAMTASIYSYLGGFDGTSNLQAASLYNIPCVGTHAHSFVNSFTDNYLIKVKDLTLKNTNLWDSVLKIREDNNWINTNIKELAAFVSYAYGFPNNMLALVDTYDTLKSGVPNFLCVAIVLSNLGYTPHGIRLDSGDLAYLSKKTREMFNKIGEKYNIEHFKHLKIAASNDIDEDVLRSLNDQGHEINIFGIGTNLVTCKKQPALGMVYKMVDCEDNSTLKLSEQIEKITIPGRKRVFRLYTTEGPFVDVMITKDEMSPQIGKQFLCRHPFVEMKKMNVIPIQVEELTKTIKLKDHIEVPLIERRKKCIDELSNFREDYKRSLNPTKYKVSISDNLYRKMHYIIEKEAPIPTYN